MQNQKLTNEQRNIRQWRIRRNHLICELLTKNPMMLRAEALQRANQVLPMPRRK